jgi:hypothetical protein
LGMQGKRGVRGATRWSISRWQRREAPDPRITRFRTEAAAAQL